ncbi:hypothetical protein GGF31_006893 [Allomyces arbusculus]|nr:hypothetical protein GGF31_006893 [Allomyces arbusculus]
MSQLMSTKRLRPRGWRQSDHISSRDWRYSPLFNYLHAGEFLSSNNGKYHLIMEPSGDLALYDSWLWIAANRLWCSNSAGKGDGAPYTLEISLDRSATSAVHITSKSGAIVWDMGVRKEPTANCLYVSDEGKIVVSDFFRCETFHTIETTPKPRRDTFAETVVPSIRDAMAATIAMQDAILAGAPSSNAIADTLAKAMPAVTRHITIANTAAKTIMHDLEHRMSMATSMRAEIATILPDLQYDPASLSAAAKPLEQRYDEVLRYVFDAQLKREAAEGAVKSFEEQYEKRLQSRGQASRFELAIGNVLGTWDVTTSDIDRARRDLEVRKNEEKEVRMPLKTLDAQLVAIYMRKYDTDGKRDKAELRLAGLQAEIEALQAECRRCTPVQQCVFAKLLQLGNPTRILKLEPWPSGFVTMTPLIRALKDIVDEVVAANFLDETEAAKLEVSMSTIQSKGEEIKQLKIESCKAIEDFFY